MRQYYIACPKCGALVGIWKVFANARVELNPAVDEWGLVTYEVSDYTFKEPAQVISRHECGATFEAWPQDLVIAIEGDEVVAVGNYYRLNEEALDVVLEKNHLKRKLQLRAL